MKNQQQQIKTKMKEKMNTKMKQTKTEMKEETEMKELAHGCDSPPWRQEQKLSSSGEMWVLSSDF